VLSGTVEFGNPQGTLTLAANEAAYAEVGKAPVKLVLVQPRERVQWVNAMQPDPLPHLTAEPLPAALEPVRTALAAGQLDRARSALAQTRAQAPAPGAPPWNWPSPCRPANGRKQAHWRSSKCPSAPPCRCGSCSPTCC
jgi:hypothetical protein